MFDKIFPSTMQITSKLFPNKYTSKQCFVFSTYYCLKYLVFYWSFSFTEMQKKIEFHFTVIETNLFCNFEFSTLLIFFALEHFFKSYLVKRPPQPSAKIKFVRAIEMKLTSTWEILPLSGLLSWRTHKHVSHFRNLWFCLLYFGVRKYIQRLVDYCHSYSITLGYTAKMNIKLDVVVEV